jgi:hypothetical protein
MPIGLVGPALQGANFISRFGVPLLQQAGITAGLAGLGALANTTLKAPSNVPRTDRRANVHRNRGALNAIDYGKYGPTDWNPNANPLSAPPAPVLPPPSGGAADRAYQQELSRTAQLTAQDPELQRYEKARAAAKSQEEMNSVRDMGLAMWQEKYGKTPMGQPGGAIGTVNPLMRSTFGYQTGMSPGDVAKTITNPSVVPVSPGEAPYQMGDLGTRVTSETGYDPAAYGLSPELIKAYQEQLLKQAGSK